MKPFVTEYKSNPRRSRDAFDSPTSNDASFDVQPETPRNWAMQEDGYEAAMRAADALFMPSPKFASNASAPNAMPAPPAEPADPTASHEPTAVKPGAPQGGRILQAIEVAPVDPFAALEAEFAPKRRGRKPGSKNRPKAAVATVIVPEPTPKAKPPSPIRTKEAPIVALTVAAPRSETSPRRTERFAWVRTSLRPGERWKRRLPKVTW